MILRLRGELDDVSVTDLRQRISRYIDDYDIKHLTINMKELTFLDSSGIGFIIGRYHQLKRIGGDIQLCCLNSKIERIVCLSGLLKIVSVKSNEEVCINSIGG